MDRFARFARLILISQGLAVCVASLHFGCLGSIGLGLMFKLVPNVAGKIMLLVKRAAVTVY